MPAKNETKPSKPFLIGDLVGELGRRAPFDWAEDWDNVGFLAGDPAEAVRAIVTSVNLGPEALAAARKLDANVIVCHHPPIFKPISKVTRASAPYLYDAIRAGISIVSLHTNFDLASNDLNQDLSAKLGLTFNGFLTPRGNAQLPRSVRFGKFITYLPQARLEAMRAAVFDAGAGHIGNYSHCSFSWEGEGTFLGENAATPTVGSAGRLEQVREKRLEVIFPWNKLERVLAAARKAHPYEEMAYDIIELAQPTATLGYGFVGDVSVRNFNFHKLLGSVKQTFQLNSVTVAGPGLSDPDIQVRRVAFSPGSGSSFVGAASAKGVDAYICGEVGYHHMLEARQKGLTLVLLGHSYSERFFIETVASWCEKSKPAIQVQKVFETVHDVL